MESQTINRPILYKLLGASDIKTARRLGQSITLIDITHGDKSARVTPEASGVLLVEYSGEVYELEAISNQTIGRIAGAI